jgi:HEPN domain-containing protein
MNETVREWVAKAEDDRRVARREFAADPNPSFDAACFHAALLRLLTGGA